MKPKKRKTHLLLGSISTAWSANSTAPEYKSTSYWTLFVKVETFHGSQQEKIYVFSNLVPTNILQTLEQQSFQNKKYYFECENRVRGWRLKDWKEIN